MFTLWWEYSVKTSGWIRIQIIKADPVQAYYFGSGRTDPVPDPQHWFQVPVRRNFALKKQHTAAMKNVSTAPLNLDIFILLTSRFENNLSEKSKRILAALTKG